MSDFALLALLSGCAYPNQFQNVRSKSPHAILVGDGVAVTHINGQPTSFWRSRERFNILPGPTTLRTVAGYWDVHDYPVLQFAAEPGHRYFLGRISTNGADRVVLSESDKRTIAQTERLQTK